MKRLIFFIINILIGFLIDICMFMLMMKFGADQFLARALSVGIAFLSTWKPNNFFIFIKLRKVSFIDTLRYGIAGFFSAILNYAIYVRLLIFIPNVQLLMAVVLSSIPSMLFVILLYSRFVFKKASYFRK